MHCTYCYYRNLFSSFLFLIRSQEAKRLYLIIPFTINQKGEAHSYVHSFYNSVISNLLFLLIPALQKAVDNIQDSSCPRCPCLCSLTTQALWHFVHNSHVNWTWKWPFPMSIKKRDTVMACSFSGYYHAKVRCLVLGFRQVSEGWHLFLYFSIIMSS